MFWLGNVFFAVFAQFYFEIWRCFHFNAVVANKSPKLTPSASGFSSKAAAAQLSLPLASRWEFRFSGFLAFFGWAFRVFEFFAWFSAPKFYGFFWSAAQRFGSELFQGISPEKAAAGFLQSLSRETFSSLCKGDYSPAGAGYSENSFGFVFLWFSCKVFSVFFLVAFEFFRANKPPKLTPDFMLRLILLLLPAQLSFTLGDRRPMKTERYETLVIVKRRGRYQIEIREVQLDGDKAFLIFARSDRCQDSCHLKRIF